MSSEFETGARSHLDRMNLTNRLGEMLEPLLAEHGFDVTEYGQNVLIGPNSSLQARLRKLDVKKSDAVNMLKFSPDLLVSRRNPHALFMVDVKVSITPMFFDSAINALREISKIPTLDRHRIGEVEREAFENYTQRYPPKKVAICIAAPYSPELVHMEWASMLKPLFRFEADTNKEADGSGTPHINIDLGAMRPLRRFLTEEFGVVVDEAMCQDVLDIAKQWPLNKPGRVNWVQYNNAILNLRRRCPWLQGRVPDNHVRLADIRRTFARLGAGLDIFKTAS